MRDLVWVAHGLFFSIFAIFALRLFPRRAGTIGARLPAAAAHTAPHARTLLFMHAAAFGFLYFALGRALYTRPLPSRLFPAQPILGALTILAGSVLSVWSLLVFRSWRLLARLEAGHELCTRGPFALVRHPIYASLDLLALGTVLWVPDPGVLVGAAAVALTGDRRARAEEALLERAYGDAYRSYARRVRRFLPWVY